MLYMGKVKDILFWKDGFFSVLARLKSISLYSKYFPDVRSAEILASWHPFWTPGEALSYKRGTLSVSAYTVYAIFNLYLKHFPITS